MSGLFLLFISFNRWTVAVFPKLQQFQLAMTKEPGVEQPENPPSFCLLQG